jgi:hypothetical protein
MRVSNARNAGGFWAWRLRPQIWPVVQVVDRYLACFFQRGFLQALSFWSNDVIDEALTDFVQLRYALRVERDVSSVEDRNAFDLLRYGIVWAENGTHGYHLERVNGVRDVLIAHVEYLSVEAVWIAFESKLGQVVPAKTEALAPVEASSVCDQRGGRECFHQEPVQVRVRHQGDQPLTALHHELQVCGDRAKLRERGGSAPVEYDDGQLSTNGIIGLIHAAHVAPA